MMKIYEKYLREKKKMSKREIADEIERWDSEVPMTLRKKFDKIITKYLKGIDPELRGRDAIMKLSDKKVQSLYDELKRLEVFYV